MARSEAIEDAISKAVRIRNNAIAQQPADIWRNIVSSKSAQSCWKGLRKGLFALTMHLKLLLHSPGHKSVNL